MREKLQVAGVLAGTDPPEWRLIWRVEEYKLTLKIAVYVQSQVDDGLWGGMVRYRPSSGHGIDDLTADSVTWEVILKMSAGIMKLVEARTAAAQQGATPGAGSD